MRILVIPGSYKSTIKSIVAAKIIADAIQETLSTALVRKLVLADGGEGTIEMFSTHFSCQTEKHSVHNPLGKLVSAQLCFLDTETAIIESSQAIGFSLLSPIELNPFLTSSYGLGELIICAIKKGVTKILVTMGDSSTMDMGIGMLAALGVEFFSESGARVSPLLSNLNQIVDFDDTKLRFLRDRVEFLGLVDTDDFLCGKIGQVQLYGKQKGLLDSDIPLVEAAYFKFSAIIQKHYGIDVTKVIRATGSGGVAASLHAFLNAKLINTLDYLSEKLDFDAQIQSADIVITGEGCLDNQTRLGKVPYYVASRCPNRCIGIFGQYTKEGFADMNQACKGFVAFTTNPTTSMESPEDSLRAITHSIASLL
jgi:glycerate 2-kinase